MATTEAHDQGLKWQVGVWDRISLTYLREVDARFTPVIDGVIHHAKLKPGERVLDLGTGTGSVALKATSSIGPDGIVTAIDISPEMLVIARQRSASTGLADISFHLGRAEEIPVPSAQFDVVLASLSLMYVIDRDTAARELARVLRPGGRLAAAVWGSPEEADIVLLRAVLGTVWTRPPFL
jgi:ubiquinone/menaquinone biosynthesis C-methylase UbiE